MGLKASTKKLLASSRFMKKFSGPKERKTQVKFARVKLETARVKRIKKKLKAVRNK